MSRVVFDGRSYKQTVAEARRTFYPLHSSGSGETSSLLRRWSPGSRWRRGSRRPGGWNRVSAVKTIVAIGVLQVGGGVEGAAWCFRSVWQCLRCGGCGGGLGGGLKLRTGWCCCCLLNCSTQASVARRTRSILPSTRLVHLHALHRIANTARLPRTTYAQLLTRPFCLLAARWSLSPRGAVALRFDALSIIAAAESHAQYRWNRSN
jgi:hypothetical protein